MSTWRWLGTSAGSPVVVVISRSRVVPVTIVVGALLFTACSGSDDVRSTPDDPGALGSSRAAAADVGEPLSPRLESELVWSGSELLSYGGTVVESGETTNGVVSVDLDTLDVTRVFDPPPFGPSFRGDVRWVDDRVYFSGSECRDGATDAETDACSREPVLATLEPDGGVWEALDPPPGTAAGLGVIGSVPGIGVLAIAGNDTTQLWARSPDGGWSELPAPALQESRPGDLEPPLGYFVMASCVVGEQVVQLGAERLPGTTSRDITAGVLDLGEGDGSEWRTSVRPELATDAASHVLCGDEAVMFSPLTGPSGPITRFSPEDRTWASIGPSTVELDGVEPPYGILGRPGTTGREVVYPGAPGVGSQIVDISTGEWRAGPPSPGMFEDEPTWTGNAFVGVSATGTAGDFTTPEPMDLPPAGSLFVFDVP